MKTVLCYGDSNTWGAAPMTSWDEQPRHGLHQRWTGVLQQALGADWQVIAEGLPGRTTVLKDPIDGDHLSGLAYLRPCLESHKPIDVVVLMLGTNDFKRRFGMAAEDVAAGVARLFAEIAATLPGPAAPRLVLLAPPQIRVTGIFTTTYAGAEEKFAPLPALLRALAARQGAAFLDLAEIVEVSPVDGIHLEAEAHQTIGTAIAELLR
jgi:lysophospholipase L1-like esterase